MANIRENKKNGNIDFSTITFKGDTIEYTSLASDEVKTGTYVIEDGKVLISYDNGKSDAFEYDEETDTLSFFGVLTYSKVK